MIRIFFATSAAVIPGFSVAGFEGKAFRTNYYNASQQPYIDYTQNQITGNSVATTLGQTLAEAPVGTVARVINSGRPKQTAVLLGPDFFSSSAANQSLDLFHEAIHEFTGWNDGQIFGAFKKYGLSLIDPYETEDINDWLARDCKR